MTKDMTTETFLERLGTALHSLQMPDEWVTDLRAEVAVHLAESGEDPLDAFGTPEALASDLAGRHGDDETAGRSGAQQPMEVDPAIQERGSTAGWHTAPIYTQRGQWSCAAEPRDVLDQAAAIVTARRGSVVDRTERTLTVRLGSRAALRLFGTMMAAGRTRLPMRLQLTATPTPAGTDVDAVLTEDAGRYLIHLGMTQGPYKQSFDTLLEALLAATSGTTTASV